MHRLNARGEMSRSGFRRQPADEERLTRANSRPKKEAIGGGTQAARQDPGAGQSLAFVRHVNQLPGALDKKRNGIAGRLAIRRRAQGVERSDTGSVQFVNHISGNQARIQSHEPGWNPYNCDPGKAAVAPPAVSCRPVPVSAQVRAQEEAPVVRGTNGVGEYRGTGSFQNIPHRPQSLRFFYECMFLMHREKDDLRRTSAAQFRHRLEAIQDRHRDVRDDHVRVQTVACLQKCAPVRNGADNIEFLVESKQKFPQECRIVIGKQNLESGMA